MVIIKKMNKRMKQMINNINLIYRYFVVGELNDIDKLISDKLYIANPNKIKNIINNIDELILLISKYLNKNWKFERLNNLEKAILINATYDIKFGKIDKKLIINESIEIIKIFSINENYKYINAILDNL